MTPDRWVELLVLVAPMIPVPGEAPADYWTDTRYNEEVREHFDDGVALFYQDVPQEWVSEALRLGRAQSEMRMGETSPLKAWPDVPTRVLLCRNDRFDSRVPRRSAGLCRERWRRRMEHYKNHNAAGQQMCAGARGWCRVA